MFEYAIVLRKVQLFDMNAFPELCSVSTVSVIIGSMMHEWLIDVLCVEGNPGYNMDY